MFRLGGPPIGSLEMRYHNVVYASLAVFAAALLGGLSVYMADKQELIPVHSWMFVSVLDEVVLVSVAIFVAIIATSSKYRPVYVRLCAVGIVILGAYAHGGMSLYNYLHPDDTPFLPYFLWGALISMLAPLSLLAAVCAMNQEQCDDLRHRIIKKLNLTLRN